MLEKYFTTEEIDKLVEVGPEKVKLVFEAKQGCGCKECQKQNENLFKHLEHDFYKNANDYREQERIGQIVKGAEKYPNPFTPEDWTAKELLQHAMQENIDQGHYIYGLFEKIEAMEIRAIALEHALKVAKSEAEYWRLRAIKNEPNAVVKMPQININVDPPKIDVKKLHNDIKKAIEGGEING